MVGHAGQILRCLRGETDQAGGEPGLRGDGDFGAACGYGRIDFAGGVAD